MQDKTSWKKLSLGMARGFGLEALVTGVTTGLATYACTQSLRYSVLNSMVAAGATWFYTPRASAWKRTLKQQGYTGDISTEGFQPTHAAIATAGAAALTALHTDFNELGYFATGMAVKSYLLYGSYTTLQSAFTTGDGKLLKAGLVGLVAPKKAYRMTRHLHQEQFANITSMPQEKRQEIAIAYLTVPEQDIGLSLSPRLERRILSLLPASPHFSLASQKPYTNKEAAFVFDQQYKYVRTQVASDEDALFVALIAQRMHKPDVKDCWRDFFARTRNVLHEQPPEESHRVVRIPFGKDGEELALFQKPSFEARQLHYEESLIEQHLTDSSFYTPLTLPLFEERPESVFQLHYQYPSFAAVLERLSPPEQQKLLAQDITNMHTLVTLLSRKEFADRKLVDFTKKHLTDPLVKDTRYVQALNDAIGVLKSSHATAARPLLDYHPENRLYNASTGAFITIDHENKGKGHPFLDLVNLLEYGPAGLRWDGFASRLHHVDAYANKISYVSTAPQEEYAAANFLRQDAFLRAWFVGRKKTRDDGIIQLNNTLELLASIQQEYGPSQLNQSFTEATRLAKHKLYF